MTRATGRLFALIPAAGRSRRMGTHKLLLTLEGRTVIDRLLTTLAKDGITDRIVVVRADDEPLCEAARSAGGTVVQPSVDPPDMRDSVEFGLRWIEERHAPRPDDGWILLPADHPVLDPSVLGTLIAAWQERTCPILVPAYRGKRGHPTFFRWELVADVRGLPPDCGLNRLLQERQDDVCELPVDNPAVVTDLDTPADYQALLNRPSKGGA